MRGREVPDPGPVALPAGLPRDARRPERRAHDYVRHTTASQWVYHEWERSLDAVLVLDVIFPVGRLAVIGLVLASRRVRVGRGARRAPRAGSGIDGPTRAPPGVNHLG